MYNNIMLKYYCISCEGIDKSGKYQVLKYLDILGKHKYVLMDRGLMSNITYARMFNRSYTYDINQFKYWIFVHLYCDKADWEVRCKLTNEPTIDYKKNIDAFEETTKEFKKHGFHVLSFNTTNLTPYNVAKQVIAYIDKLNRQEEEKNKQLEFDF